MLGAFFVSCSKDEPSGKSIFVDADEQSRSEFDKWLERHYIEPYNILFEYRMPDRQTNFGYWVTPPTIDKSIEIAKLIRFGTLDAMTEMYANGDPQRDPTLFAKMYFPKVLFMVGSFEISNTGAVALGSAENGLQINILGVNFFDRNTRSVDIIGLLAHEFTHILAGTRPVTTEFKAICEKDYVGDTWTSAGNDYLQLGFLSNYGRKSDGEDLAELVASYLTHDQAWWDGQMALAGASGSAKLEEKLSITMAWLDSGFDVDMAKWRDVTVRRISEIGSIDWQNLDD
ncbi:hypothetical protein FACS1894159_09530 [Bacteroidia bacterium]|nr:hypothetical protein FACS1894159_09530 [Bacteroidia bacterium]